MCVSIKLLIVDVYVVDIDPNLAKCTRNRNFAGNDEIVVTGATMRFKNKQ